MRSRVKRRTEQRRASVRSGRRREKRATFDVIMTSCRYHNALCLVKNVVDAAIRRIMGRRYQTCHFIPVSSLTVCIAFLSFFFCLSFWFDLFVLSIISLAFFFHFDFFRAEFPPFFFFFFDVLRTLNNR